tara:strand:+ start:1923 stop:2252 length:330 start_codon:yes stop_codon:yes gene_type:complete
MEMKEAGAHRLTYMNYKGEFKVEMVTHVSSLKTNARWINLTKVKIPVGKVAFVQCPSCKSDNWTDDSPHLKGYSCGGCGNEILLHTDEELVTNSDLNRADKFMKEHDYE